MRWHKYYAHAQRERETREQTTLGVCCISTWLVRSITQGWGNRGAMSRLQALATRAHASNPWPSTLCGSPSVVPPTITVVERGRIRGGSVRRRSNAGWRGFRFPRQFSNDSDGVDARFLRKHIWQRARFDYRSKATRLYADLFSPRVGVILWYRERFFIFHVFVYPIDLSFIPVTRNATRTLCSTFVPEPAHQSPCDEWAKNLFFLRYYFQFGRNRHTYFSVPSVRSDIGSRCTFQGERERKKEFCGTSRSGRARVRCGISSSVENNSGKSIVVRRVEWWIEERINSKTNLGRPDVRLNAIARFIFNLLAEESPSMQFKRSRRISFQTRNDDFLFDGRSPLNARVRVRCYKSVEVSALYPAVDVISVDSQLSHVR